MRTRIMSRAALLAFCGLAFALSVALLQQWRPEDAAPVAPPHLAETPPTPQVLQDAPDRAIQMAALLARPLFEPTRRPPAVAAADSAPQAAIMPRVTGVLVGPADRNAIFLVPGVAAPLVAREGGRVGDYTVQSIAAGQVTLQGPGGPLMLRPTFDKNSPRPVASPPAALAIGGAASPRLPAPPSRQDDQ
jgi:hypothetical protein